MSGLGRFHRVGPVRAGGEESGRERVPGPGRVTGGGRFRQPARPAGRRPGGVTIVDPAPFLTTVMVLQTGGARDVKQLGLVRVGEENRRPDRVNEVQVAGQPYASIIPVEDASSETGTPACPACPTSRSTEAAAGSAAKQYDGACSTAADSSHAPGTSARSAAAARSGYIVRSPPGSMSTTTVPVLPGAVPHGRPRAPRVRWSVPPPPDPRQRSR